MPKKLQTEHPMQVGELRIRVIRTPRRSIALQVKPEGIILRSPLMCAEYELQNFAQRQYTWLVERSRLMQQQQQAAQKHFSDNEAFKLLDQTFTLQLHYQTQQDTYFADNRLHIFISNRVKHERAYIKKKVYQWYQQQALDYLQPRSNDIAKTMGLPFQSLKVRDYKARWGSCSSQGDLSFNWRIIMAPPTAIDAVIIHEIAHLKHFNHSPAFWQLVHQMDPDYKAHHEWFNQNRLALMF